jgi:hypothetical protein
LKFGVVEGDVRREIVVVASTRAEEGNGSALFSRRRQDGCLPFAK